MFITVVFLITPDRELHAEIQTLKAEKQELEASLSGLTSQEDQDKRELQRIRGVVQNEKRKADSLTKKLVVRMCVGGSILTYVRM